MKKFSLLETIKDILEGRSLSKETLDVINYGKQESSNAGVSSRGQIVLPLEWRSDILAQTALAGAEIVSVEKMPLLPALRAKTVLGQLGATFYTNLKGDVSIPTYAGSSCNWSGEVSSATDGGAGFSEVTLTPHRLTSYIDVSKQFLAQDSISAEAALIQDLINSILVKVEATAFGADAGTAAKPAGLFYGANFTGSLSGETTFEKLVGMKAAIDASNALNGSLAYVTNPHQSYIMQTTPLTTGDTSTMIMTNDMVAGYPVVSTNNVGTKGIIGNYIAFGNWSDFVIGQWGSMDITIDPYTQAKNGKVRIIVNTFWDFKVRRTESFNLNYLYSVGEVQPVIPTVTSDSVSGVTTTGATINANVTALGYTPILEKGIFYSLTSGVTSADIKVTETGLTTGNYTVILTGLTTGTQYYVKAFATNLIGTGYGDEITFTTS